jgi:hypothetical protein
MIVETKEERDVATGTSVRRTSMLFPRFHQWEAVTNIVGAVADEGVGQRYLIGHSAGSGKTNTIAWTAHRLARLHVSDEKVFDSVIVVVDRTVLDGQLQDAIRQIDGTGKIVATISPEDVRKAGAKSKSGLLARALKNGELIIAVTVQTFPFALDEIRADSGLKGKRFAVIADEAHSSQSGQISSKLKQVLTAEEIKEIEDGGSVDVEAILASEMTERAEGASPPGRRAVGLAQGQQCALGSNRSWNCGAEGDTDDAEVLGLRERQQRNFLATLMLSQGVTMLVAGDESGRTQLGNNNAYCQDNEVSWLDWEHPDSALREFTTTLIALRREHPVLRPRRWSSGGQALGGTGIGWCRPDGLEMSDGGWSSGWTSVGVFLNGQAITGKDQRGQAVVDDSFLVLFNGHYEGTDWTLPKQWGESWTVLLDTAAPDRQGQAADGGQPLPVAARSVTVLIRPKN